MNRTSLYQSIDIGDFVGSLFRRKIFRCSSDVQCAFDVQQKEENDRRNYFMINLQELDWVEIELATPGLPLRGTLRLMKTYRVAYPGIQLKLPCTPQDNFSWVPNCSLGPLNAKRMCPKKNWYGLCEIAWPVSMATHSEFEMGRSAYKITHISAVTYPRLLNNIKLKTPCCICKLSNLHIYKYL